MNNCKIPGSGSIGFTASRVSMSLLLDVAN